MGVQWSGAIRLVRGGKTGEYPSAGAGLDPLEAWHGRWTALCDAKGAGLDSCAARR